MSQPSMSQAEVVAAAVAALQTVAVAAASLAISHETLILIFAQYIETHNPPQRRTRKS